MIGVPTRPTARSRTLVLGGRDVLRIAAVLLYACAVCAAQGPRPTDYTVEPMVVDAEKDNGPQRIVSVAPSITEMCAALGMADRVVGRTQYCTHPPTVENAAIVGAQTDTNLEKILELRPDVVLLTEGSRKRMESRLKGIGLRIEVLPDNDTSDTFKAIEKLGKICERPRTAARLVNTLNTDLERLSERAGNHREQRVLFAIADLPLRAGSVHIGGPGGHLDDLLRRAGYTNAAATVVNKSWVKIGPEAILQANPDYILEFRPPAKSVDSQLLYAGWSQLSSVPAIGNRRIRSLTSATALIPGPRLNIALHEVISALADR